MYWSQINSRQAVEDTPFLDGPSYSSRLKKKKRRDVKPRTVKRKTVAAEPSLQIAKSGAARLAEFNRRRFMGFSPLSIVVLAFALSFVIMGCAVLKDIAVSEFGESLELFELTPSETIAAASGTDGKSPVSDELQFPQSGMDEWSYLPYWGGTVAENGCGLCSYTSMVDILLDERYTPADMLAMRGDWEGMDGYVADTTGSTDIGSHNEWTLTAFGIYERRLPVELASLASSLDSGSVVIACAGGERFKASSGYVADYPGHFVCIYAHDPASGNFYVHDSSFSHGYGCAVEYSAEEMSHFLAGTTSLVAYSKVSV